MGLTYPGSQALVDAIYAELARLYPAVPSHVTFGDEPAGDFGIAHFLGADPSDRQTCRITFDATYVPSRYVIAHELGHALSWNVTLKRGGNGFTNGLYDEFWAARGFPGTPWEGQLRAIDGDNTRPNGGYRYWPEENFADAFGAVNSWGQGSLITEGYGIYLDEDRLRAFYKSLEGAFDVAITDEDIDKIARAIATRILPEVVGAIKAGFNVTLPTELDRLAQGDTKVETAEIEKA